MYEVRITERAKKDLRGILAYVREEAGDAIAAKLIERIEHKIARLAVDALRYPVRPALGTDRRAILVKPYIVFYRVRGDIVFVQRVLHGARDITAIFSR